MRYTKAQVTSLTNVQAIKTYFEGDGGRTVEMKEMKDLSMEGREELGRLSKEALMELATDA